MPSKWKHRILTTLGGLGAGAAVVKVAAAAMVAVLGPTAGVVAAAAAGVTVAVMALTGDLKKAWGSDAQVDQDPPAASPPAPATAAPAPAAPAATSGTIKNG